MEKWAPVPLRLSLGLIFLLHGLQKAFGLLGGSGLKAFAEFLKSLGFTPPLPWAYLASYAELVCGFFLLIGLLTRTSSVLLLVLIVTAAVKVHLPNGFFLMNNGVEYTLLIAAGCISILVSGPGKISVDEYIK